MRLLVVLCLALGLGAAELELRTVEWGFGGRVLLGSFAPCDLQLANLGERPISGVLRLRDAGALGGVAWDTEVWIGAGATRWVRFAPLIRSGDNERRFVLSWRGGGDITTLPPPGVAAPGPVLLTDDGEAPRRVRLPTCPAGRFPTGSALLDGLGCLVVETVPRGWDAAQAAALATWVRGGGTLALLRPAAGGQVAPEGFGPGLRLGRNGSGRVLAVPQVRESCGLDELAAAGWRPPVWHAEGKERREDADAATARVLAGLVRPEHPWGLIRTVLIIFGLGIGPLAWWLGRRGTDWRWLNLGLIAAIVLATLALVHLGRRGYGEAAVWSSVALLRPAGDRVEAEVRAAVFVTTSAARRISHESPLNLYACPAEEVPVEGAVVGGTLITNIPLYSSRNLLWRGSVALPLPQVAVVKRTDGRPSELTITGLGPVWEAAVWDGSRLHHLSAQGEVWREWGTAATPESLGRDSRPTSGATELAEAGRSLFPTLVLRALGGLGQTGAWLERPLAPGEAVLLAMAAAPAGLAPSQGLAEPHRGLAVWRIDLPKVAP